MKARPRPVSGTNVCCRLLSAVLFWTVLLVASVLCATVLLVPALVYLAACVCSLTCFFENGRGDVDALIEEFERKVLFEHVRERRNVFRGKDAFVFCVEGKHAYPLRTCPDRTDPKDTIRYDMRYMYVEGDREDAPVLVLVHGAASSSVTFARMIDHLRKDFNIYALDLPGFGRSVVHVDSYAEFRRVYLDDDMAAFLVEAVRAFLRWRRLRGVYLCGHSYGGFVCAKLAYQHPSLVRSLVLINSAGIFPTLGRLGMYWAFVFSYSIPNVGVYLGSLGYALATVLFAHVLPAVTRRSYTEELYWYYLASHPSALGHRFLRDEIAFRPDRAYWKRPVFSQLHKLSCDLCLVYGERDSIAPIHQALVLQRMCGGALSVIRNGGHRPMWSAEGAREVAQRIAQFVTNRERCSSGGVGRCAARHALGRGLERLQSEDYAGSFYIHETVSVVQQFYADLARTLGDKWTVDVHRLETGYGCNTDCKLEIRLHACRAELV